MSRVPHQSLNCHCLSLHRKGISPDFTGLTGSVAVYYVEADSSYTRYDFYSPRLHHERAV